MLILHISFDIISYTSVTKNESEEHGIATLFIPQQSVGKEVSTYIPVLLKHF